MSYEPLWKEIFDKYYDVSYQELLVDRLVSRWAHIDIFFRFLIAATASGSAISGWAVWSNPELKIVWSVISSIAALSSLLYGVIPISQLIKEGTKSHSEFNALRVQFDQMILDFKMDQGGNLDKHRKELAKLTGSAANLWQKAPRFPFISEKMKIKSQKDLNAILFSKGMIQEGE